MARIIPGVQVSVVKEVVPPQLAPSGVLGLIGITEKIPEETERASSWSRFVEVFGPGSAFSMPEARQALQNGIFELVVCPLKEGAGKKAFVEIPASNPQAKKEPFKLVARAAGPWANDVAVKVTGRKTIDKKDVFDLEIQRPGTSEFEVHRNLSMDPGTDDKPNARYVGTVLKDASDMVIVEDVENNVQPAATTEEKKHKLAGGKDASTSDYCDALSALVNESDVDMVLASIQDSEKNAVKAIKINSEIISHCQLMSEDSKGRIGFGQVVQLIRVVHIRLLCALV